MANSTMPEKSLSMLEDMLGAESMAIKKYQFYTANCTDPNLKTVCEKAAQMHRKHLMSGRNSPRKKEKHKTLCLCLISTSLSFSTT